MTDMVSLQTKRLLIRVLSRADAAALYRYRSDPRVGLYQNFRPQSIAAAAAFIAQAAPVPNRPDTWHQLGLFLLASGELVGDIGLHFLGPDAAQVEIGYTLAPEYQGQGLASEAVCTVIDHLFNVQGKHRIIASVDPRNTSSLALLNRLGFRKEAHFRRSLLFDGEWADDVVYAVLAEEWPLQR